MNENPVAIRSKSRLAAALGLLLEDKGLDSITITELCLRAGLSRPAFYQNFSSMRDVAAYHLGMIVRDAVGNQDASRLEDPAAFVQTCCGIYDSVRDAAGPLIENGLADMVVTQCADAFSELAPRSDPRYGFVAAGIAHELIRKKGSLGQAELVEIVQAVLG